MAGMEHFKDVVRGRFSDRNVVVIRGEVFKDECPQGLVGPLSDMVVEWIHHGIRTDKAAIKIVRNIEAIHEQGKTLASLCPVTVSDAELK